MTRSAREFLTVGHSNRSLTEFLEILTGAQIAHIVDVRKLAGSARYPHFDEGPLSAALTEHGIGYERCPALAGRRPVAHEVPDDVNGWWQNRSFHNYADYALSAEFDAALTALQACGERQTTAVMCAEAVWWRCHRRIIADHLLARGVDVAHVMGDRAPTPAEVSAGAAVDPAGRVTYPAQ